jgi:hypothetical protein
MVIVPSSRAFRAPKHDIVGLVDEFWGHVNDGILAVILFPVFHFLLGRFAVSERPAGGALLCTILTAREIWGGSVLLLINVDAAFAL